MKRTLIAPDLADFPSCFHPLMSGARVYDSSCSEAARVYYIERDGGYYLKAAPSGTLATEMEMTRYFNEKGLGASVAAYLRTDRDWLLCERVAGEDCTARMYLDDPMRLSALLGELLAKLHATPYDGCPVADRTRVYLATAEKNYREGNYDRSHFPDSFGYRSAEEAWAVIERDRHLLKSDTLLHGDYCLPNIMLDGWKPSGFIDLDGAGVGDRHIDLFWGIWTLNFNLGTYRYTDRFIDAYGRDRVEPDMLRLVAAAEVFG